MSHTPEIYDLVNWISKDRKPPQWPADAKEAPLLHTSTPSTPLPKSDSSLIYQAAIIASALAP
jgi:hypothetical protein